MNPTEELSEQNLGNMDVDPQKLVRLDEPFYTAEQIVVPSELPEILKQFTKAAIKTQPPDLIEWACR